MAPVADFEISGPQASPPLRELKMVFFVVVVVFLFVFAF